VTRKIRIYGVLLACTACCAAALPAAGQDSMLKRLRGIVSDAEDQQLLVGVHVFARVAHTGAVSDDRGVFNLTVDPMDTLIITTVGYMRQIVPLAYFREQQIDLLVQMDAEVIELPGITIMGKQEITYLNRTGKNPHKIYAYKPSRDHPNLDIPVGSLQYGPLSRWGKEAKEKRKLLRVYQNTAENRLYIQTLSSDSVRTVFANMYGVNQSEYDNFVIFLNTIRPRMNKQSKKDIIRVMHETFLRYKPRKH
jgi:hypothetical protein